MGQTSDELGVFKYQLEAIVDEMYVTLARTSHSHVVREGGDCSAALFNNGVEQLVQSASSIPIHLNMMPEAVNAVVETVGSREMSEGDVFLINDPYYGASHLNDLFLVRPLFSDRRISGFGVAVTHHQEIGGMVPGGAAGTTTEIFQEGLRIPPIRLMRRDRFNEDVLKLMKGNVRTPDFFIGDLRAQVAALKLGELRLAEMVRKTGVSVWEGLADSFVQYGERRMREELRRIPAGKFEGLCRIDDDGIQDLELEVRVSIQAQGGSLTVDFHGSSPQARGPINGHRSLSIGSVFCVIYGMFDRTIPANAGSMRPIKVILPEGTIVSPRPPAAVNARMVTQGAIQEAMLDALAKAMPDRIRAGTMLAVDVISGGGVDPRTEKQFVFYDSLGGGMGGRPTSDGLDGKDVQGSSVLGVPIEVLEMDYPVRVHEYSLIRDSGGAGQFRGGLGCRKSIEFLADLTVSGRTDNHKSGPVGRLGGRAGTPGEHVLQQSNGRTIKLPSKFSLVRVKKGDILTRITAGGGGFGPPNMRLRHLLGKDLREGKLSREHIQREYDVNPLDLDASS